MEAAKPTPFREATPGEGRRHFNLGAVLGILLACIFALLVALRMFGLLWPFSIPTGGMAPALAPGDHIVMEGFTYLGRQPRRGDVVVFKTDGIAASLPTGDYYVKRVAGEPGEKVRIEKGKLFINDKPVSLSNAVGEIVYQLPGAFSPGSWETNMTIPNGNYYVLGDNSSNSSDSRFWGTVPRENIIGRVAFCYRPLGRMGAVK